MVKLDNNKLVPTIIQNATTNDVITLGYMSPESFKLTLKNNQVWFFSRSRSELWHKGKTSGNYFNVQSILQDCDSDSILIKVHPTGPGCHTGNNTCFTKEITYLPEFTFTNQNETILQQIFTIIEDRKLNPKKGSYTSQLFTAGIEQISKKVIEEAGESAIAATKEDKNSLIYEVADLFFHTLVLIAALNVSPTNIWEELEKRRN